MTKRRWKRIATVALSVVIAAGMFAAAGAAQRAAGSIDMPYEYPVQPGSSEWLAMDPVERTARCQIPEDVLARLTTDALVETVVKYPFFPDMTAFSTARLGYTSVRDGFNGLQELERRPDGMERLLAYYEAAKAGPAEMNILLRAAIEITLTETDSSFTLEPAVLDDCSALRTFFPD